MLGPDQERLCDSGRAEGTLEITGILDTHKFSQVRFVAFPYSCNPEVCKILISVTLTD